MIRIAVLHVAYSVKASYYNDWLDAFMAHPGVVASPLNLFRAGERARLPALLAESDLAVILHSGTADTLDYVRKATPGLQARRCPLVVFMGNEFNVPWLPFADRRAWLKQAGADFVATQLLEATGTWLYEDSGVKVISVPHGLNPKAFRFEKPRSARSIDIGTRSFPYPIYLGNRTRNDLFAVAQSLGKKAGLAADIRTDRRLTREEWADFLNDCRFTIATEAGATHLERDDAKAFAIQEFLRERRQGLSIRPNAGIRGLARRLPWGVREYLLRVLKKAGISHEAIEDDPVLHADVMARFFSNPPSHTHTGTCISSRHFDAIGCGTVQILVQGRYNDILEPGRHYIPVKADLSNLADIFAQIAEPQFGDDIAAAALEHVATHHTLNCRIYALLRRVLGYQPA